MIERFAPLGATDPQQVAGYVLHARLGSGGMANVYLSAMPSGRPVAIKVMRQEFADDPEFRRRFKREVSVAQRVQGRYTAPVVDADPDGRPPWLAASYVAGPSLHQAVGEFGPFPVPSTMRLLAGVAEGLAAIHAAGLIHRDLKPSNVLLATDGPRVIDFGIAHAAESGTLTSTGAVMGTPAFMAPEQVAGRAVTPGTDVFALGHLVLFAATGHTAFGDGHHAAIFHRIANELPNLTDCPEELRLVVETCLAKNPDDRPTVDQVIAYVQARLDGQAIGEQWLPQPVSSTLAAYDLSAAAHYTATVGRADLARAPGTRGPAGAGGGGAIPAAAPLAVPAAAMAASAGPHGAPSGAYGSPAAFQQQAPPWGTLPPGSGMPSGPGGTGTWGAGYPPVPAGAPAHSAGPPPRRRRKRWPWVAAAAAVVVVAAGGGVGALSLTSGAGSPASSASAPATAAAPVTPTTAGSPADSGSPDAAPGSASSAGPAAATDGSSPDTPSGSAGATGGAGNPTLVGGFVQLYSDATTQFTMPGGSCNGDHTPSAVGFTAQGPVVTANGTDQSGDGDFWLHCNNSGDNGNTDIEFNQSDQAAAVTGSPDAGACNLAITRHPLAGSVLLTQLKPGVQLCLTGHTNNNGTVQGLLVRVTFVAKDATTDNVTWTATAWALPSSGN
jgi:serine/threonine kinase PknH